MALLSRSRVPKISADGRRARVAASRRHRPPPSHHPNAHNASSLPPTSPSRDHDDHQPPAKRRKLSIRTKQTTLDDYASIRQSAPPHPPTRVTVTQPHGPLIQNTNGVQTLLDADEDELALPAPTKPLPKPASSLKTDDKRTLRSQDEGPRLKSELAIYFPNYEDIIFDAPKDLDFLTVDSTLYVTDDTARPPSEPNTPNKGSKHVKSTPGHARKGSANGAPLQSTPRRSSSNQFNGSPSLNLEMIARSLPTLPEDPLTDEHYNKSHRRAERKEKQLRNIEKERAMHEKVQLDRLLEGLQGHDWLKVLGVTGITDGEAKKYEPKRDYFIAEVRALVDKFKQWREQERRQKLDKEAAVAAREEEMMEDGGEEEEESELFDSEAASSTGPPSSDLNASAARQLQQETAIALKSLAASTSTPRGKELAANPLPPVFVEPPPEVPFVSFYDKPHLRDAALGKARSGRSVTAFGHPVPELEEREFELPDEYATQDAIRANAREKRRRKRESVANASN
ncbi:something about silencing, SAS, complex subunit 4-domain-containing protein [Neohortaea acidophila]|uniref:Something about silencing, SAS, complex subunit 4-domain-containing protein n=1 Tax=Neohortaea acidophila TaxID=245834 RepID=A0A6A6PQ25_9PEZI|nr:something about silencing, SAS, complex subunit 4-domain-containing protein [Neohortaea acidophila]KAF2482220.1 something about silencing, SAS, complex subunit 4-domain-containing protein [Neohortaea acidophila]